MEVCISLLRTNTLLLSFRNMFLTILQALGNVLSSESVLLEGGSGVLCLDWLT